MKITVWGINYSPELTGIAPYNTALCDFMHARGHQVRMVSTFTYYPAWRKLPAERFSIYRTDDMDGVTLYRCWHYVPSQTTTLKRIVHEGTFVFTSFLRQLTLSRSDVLIVVSPPLLLGAAAWLLGKMKRMPFVFHVQDLQPDAAAGLGMMKEGRLMRFLYWLEKTAYKKAARLSGISQGMLNAFTKKGIASDKQLYFPNGVMLPDASHRPVKGRFRTQNGFSENDFLVVYSGNLGMKQGLEILIHAARLVKNPRIRFVICGEGSQRDRLVDMANESHLRNLTFLPLQPDLHYRELLVDADLCVITQQRGSGDFFFPSKLLMTLAFAKPVLTVADESSELAHALCHGRFGINVPPEQPAVLAEILEKTACEPERLEIFGEAGRKFVEQFELEKVLEDFESALKQIVKTRSSEGK